MDTFFEILRALAYTANIARFVLALWKEYKHKADGEGR